MVTNRLLARTLKRLRAPMWLGKGVATLFGLSRTDNSKNNWLNHRLTPQIPEQTTLRSRNSGSNCLILPRRGFAPAIQTRAARAFVTFDLKMTAHGHGLKA